VWRASEWDEWRVAPAHFKPADLRADRAGIYHTDDLDDARDTALAMSYPHDSRWKATSKHTGEVIVGRVRNVTDFTVDLHTLKDVQTSKDVARNVSLSFEHWTLTAI
jgi:hypothetical protein